MDPEEGLGKRKAKC